MDEKIKIRDAIILINIIYVMLTKIKKLILLLKYIVPNVFLTTYKSILNFFKV
jgi:hypothetical protein